MSKQARNQIKDDSLAIDGATYLIISRFEDPKPAITRTIDYRTGCQTIDDSPAIALALSAKKMQSMDLLQVLSCDSLESIIQQFLNANINLALIEGV